MKNTSISHRLGLTRSALPAQVAILLTAAALWGLAGGGGPLAWVACYLAAWAAVNYLIAAGGKSLVSFASSGQRRLVAALLLLPAAPLAWSWFSSGRATAWSSASAELLTDRLALEASPAIFPRQVHGDRPQRFYLHAAGARRLRIRLDDNGEWLPTVALGDGLFRWDYDPRRDGRPPVEEGAFMLNVACDGTHRRLADESFQPLPRSGPLAFSPDGDWLATLSEPTDELILIDRQGELTRLAVADGPVACRFVDARRLAVAHRHTPQVWIIDIVDQRVLRRLEVPPLATDLAIGPDFDTIAVAVASDPPGVVFHSAVSDSPSQFVPTGVVPEWIAFGRHAREVIVTSRMQRAVIKLVAPPPADPPGEADEAAYPFPFDSGWQLAEEVLLLPRPAVALARGWDGAQIYLSSTATADPGFAPDGNHFVEHAILAVRPGSLQVASTLLTDRRTDRQLGPGEYDSGGSPGEMVPLADGTLLAVMTGTHEVQGIDLLRGASERPTWRVDEEGLYAPRHLAADGAGRFAVASPATGLVAVYSLEGPLLFAIDVGPDERQLRHGNPAALRRRGGEIAFYETTRHGLSCHSCHTHGDSDYAQHDIGSGQWVATLSARGVAGTAPYLRDASEPRLRDTHRVAEELYGGYARETFYPRDMVLAEYLRAQPAVTAARPAPAGNAAAAADKQSLAEQRRGWQVFRKARCTLCHPPPAFTNLSQHPAGWLFPDQDAASAASVLDTPSLRGVSASAPYLHDGRAESLREVIVDCNPSNRHGDTRGLSQADQDALLAFLRSL